MHRYIKTDIQLTADTYNIIYLLDISVVSGFSFQGRVPFYRFPFPCIANEDWLKSVKITPRYR